jgi:hypothetical protein
MCMIDKCSPTFQDLSEQLKNEFSLDGKIPFREWYFNEKDVDLSGNYEDSMLFEMKLKAKKRDTNYYGKTDKWLYHALVDFPIYGKDVLIVGSVIPWYESIALEHHCKSCTVVEYREQSKPLSGISYIRPNELGEKKFDVIFSISSYEHDGLGRYGDPVNPNGDLEAMQNIQRHLTDKGVMFLAVPVGRDEIVWNAHRVYGRVRLPMLIKGWRLIGKYGITKEIWDAPFTNDIPPQPVLVLSKS